MKAKIHKIMLYIFSKKTEQVVEQFELAKVTGGGYGIALIMADAAKGVYKDYGVHHPELYAKVEIE